jgi:hypothetical protein
MVINDVEDLGIIAACERPVGDVSLPHLIRQIGLEPAPRRAGPLVRLRGDETRRDKIRQIVATAGEQPARWGRCQAIVSAPASWPASASSLRNATIASSTAWLVRRGLVCGRRDLGPNAASPSARYRAVSFCTHRRDTP